MIAGNQIGQRLQSIQKWLSILLRNDFAGAKSSQDQCCVVAEEKIELSYEHKDSAIKWISLNHCIVFNLGYWKVLYEQGKSIFILAKYHFFSSVWRALKHSTSPHADAFLADNSTLICS